MSQKRQRGRSYNLEIFPFPLFFEGGYFSAERISSVCRQPLHGENSRKHHKRVIKITHSASLPNRLRKGRRGQRDGMSSLGQLADISGFRAQRERPEEFGHVR
jgi:hypothetical protein